ncbi:MAG: hypothetical protein ACI4FN_01930 [Acutalibacteraceae bacterium]
MKIIFLSSVFLMLASIAVFRFTCCKAKENPRYTGMPDPEFVRRQKTVEKVNMVYGTDKCPITLYRPVDAYFTVAPGTALNARDRVWLRADDSSWSAEVFGVVCFENRVQSEDFVEYYYKGELSNSGEKLECFRQEVTDLGVTYMNKPVKRIKSTYKKTNEKETYEACFVGFEFDDTSNGIPSGRGLLGFKIYSIKKEISVSYIKEIFCELFYPER